MNTWSITDKSQPKILVMIAWKVNVYSVLQIDSQTHRTVNVHVCARCTYEKTLDSKGFIEEFSYKT